MDAARGGRTAIFSSGGFETPETCDRLLSAYLKLRNAEEICSRSLKSGDLEVITESEKVRENALQDVLSELNAWTFERLGVLP